MLYRTEGVVGFFRGVIPNSLKVAPSAAVTFLVYEEIMKLFKDTSVATDTAAGGQRK